MEAALQGPLGRTVLGSAVVTIGRAVDNQLVIHDPKVSSHHAEIRPGVQGYSISDLGSTNGTFVNQQRLDRHLPRLLNGGDRIHIGDMTFTYESSHSSQGASTVYAANSSQNEPTVELKPAEYTGYGQGIQLGYQSPVAHASYAPAPPAASPFTPIPQQASTPPWMRGEVPNYRPPVLQQPVTPPPVQQKPSNPLKILLIVLAVIVVLSAGGGITAYLLTRPQPVISITSDYKVGSIPAGSTGTVLHVIGHKFSGTSAITFLLDGTPVAGNQTVQSDADGNVRTDLTITSSWAVGNDTLTAKDAGGYTTKAGMTVVIVPQGQAHTPGPHGAPPDDMSFTLGVNVQVQDAVTGQQSGTYTETLLITGQPDPAGGTVCQSVDDGQPHILTGTASGGLTYRETIIWTCSGTYKGGKLSYTETATSDRIAYSNGVTCVARTPWIDQQLEGTFSSQNTISGTIISESATVDCSGLGLRVVNARKGSWTGQM